MTALTRRLFAFLIPSFGIAQQLKEGDHHPPALPSRAYLFEKLGSRPGGQMTSYPILKGNTHSGYGLDLHETELAPGASPHPPHRHAHEELLFIREGEVEVILPVGTTRLGPGSCAYMASNDLHGYRNPGTVPAKYFVLALGGD